MRRLAVAALCLVVGCGGNGVGGGAGQGAAAGTVAPGTAGAVSARAAPSARAVRSAIRRATRAPSCRARTTRSAGWAATCTTGARVRAPAQPAARAPGMKTRSHKSLRPAGSAAAAASATHRGEGSLIVLEPLEQHERQHHRRHEVVGRQAGHREPARPPRAEGVACTRAPTRAAPPAAATPARCSSIPGTRRAAINAFLGGAQTCSFGTPTAEELTALTSYAGLKDTTRANYIVLVTDGQSTSPTRCRSSRSSQPDPSGGRLRGRLRPVGGPGRAERRGPGWRHRHRGRSAVLLRRERRRLARRAFAAIASVFSCSYTLSDVPPTWRSSTSTKTRPPISRDTTHANGWDYDVATTTRSPSTARPAPALQAGQVSDLTIVYGCPIDIG